MTTYFKEYLPKFDAAVHERARALDSMDYGMRELLRALFGEREVPHTHYLVDLQYEVWNRVPEYVRVVLHNRYDEKKDEKVFRVSLSIINADDPMEAARKVAFTKVDKERRDKLSNLLHQRSYLDRQICALQLPNAPDAIPRGRGS